MPQFPQTSAAVAQFWQSIGEPGSVVALGVGTSQGYLWAATNGGGIGAPASGPGATALRTDVTSPGDDEKFIIREIGNGDFTLQTLNGHYITAVNGGGVGPNGNVVYPLPLFTHGGWLLQANSVFCFVSLGENQVRIMTPDRTHYVTASGGGGVNERGDAFRTDATKPASFETFHVAGPAEKSKTHNQP